ncbi:MAG: DUF4230 domain-containing protein, partial [Chloroflexi bacterium]|nr:DUF4230 domain-containing protein [Chloroflexota bacterium]
QAIYQQALADGILENAREFGRIYFENYLRSLGFTEIEIVIG